MSNNDLIHIRNISEQKLPGWYYKKWLLLPRHQQVATINSKINGTPPREFIFPFGQLNTFVGTIYFAVDGTYL